MKVKKKNRLHRYDINRPTSRHGLTYTKYKKCLSMMMHICIDLTWNIFLRLLCF